MSDTDKNKNPANRQGPPDERAQRLAEALRANLHRRKAQARARAGTELAETARKERIKDSPVRRTEDSPAPPSGRSAETPISGKERSKNG